MALRVALFVEGGQDVPPPRGDAPLFRIWGELLVRSLGLRELHPIVPISKKHLVAMDPSAPRMSGAAEGLDHLIARKLGDPPVFDAAIVAWDLVPAWNPQAAGCRWEETLRLYEGLARSVRLPAIWREQSAQRLNELRSRPTPSARPQIPRLVPGLVLPLCMDPMFESLLVQHEGAARRALGVFGRPVDGWPDGWGDPRARRPDQSPLGVAVNAVKRLRPAVDCARKVPGDMRTNKDGWGEWMLRNLFLDEQSALLHSHPIAERLREIALRGPP